jgi:hypothetical protein
VSDLNRRMRFLLYLYSTRNIVATTLALGGPLLLFAGVILDYWLAITAGLYAAGWLLTPAPRVVDVDLTQALSLDALRDRLDAIIARARPAVPADLALRLDSIRASIGEVLPKLAGDVGSSDDLYLVRETVLRYLPETLSNYLALPPLFRTTHALREGKTARDLLSDQLTVLDAQMREVVGNVARGDAEALLSNGRFLEAKFARRDFLSAPAGGR